MKNFDYDLLLIHPAMQTSLGPYHPIMAMGLFTIASYLGRKGFRVRVLNTALTPHVESEVKRARIVGISLHWYLHSYPAIKLVKEIRKNFPEKKIYLGGLTASHFAHEIMESCKELSGIIVGEGEKALEELLQKEEKEVTGLLWRMEQGEIQTNKLRESSHDKLDEFFIDDLFYFKEWKEYLPLSFRSPVVSYGNAREKIDHLFYVPLSRGCVHECATCGGAKSSYARLGITSCRSFSPAIVRQSLEKLQELGLSTFALEGHPSEALLAELGKMKKKPGLVFISRDLPSLKFLDLFSQVLDVSHSGLVVSPDSGSEKLRTFFKGSKSYSNLQLLHFVDRALEKEIFLNIGFTVGIPHENEEAFQETKSLIEELAKKSVVSSPHVWRLDPFAPMALDIEKYQLKKKFVEFEDYYNYSKAMAEGKLPKDSFGYETNFFDTKRLSEIQFDSRRSSFFKKKFVGRRLRTPFKYLFASFVVFLGLLLRSDRLIHWAMRE